MAVMLSTQKNNGFNPHPASLPGDAVARSPAPAQLSVSIRTRHRCRVMRAQSDLRMAEDVFQSAPGIAAG